MSRRHVPQFGHQIRPECTPRWLRPRLSSQARATVSMVHHQNLDAIARGDAEPQILWDWASGCLTWSRVAEALGQGQAEMQQQLALVERVVEMFEQQHRVAFPTPEDYQLAVDGVVVMDLLASTVDTYTAHQAALWSEATINARSQALQPGQLAESNN